MKRFDVVCAGAALWRASGAAAIFDVVEALARQGLSVGLSTALDDDRRSRHALAKAAALGVDTTGVTLSPPSREIVVVDTAGGESQVLSEGRELTISPDWSADILLLHGCSPVTSHAAALVRAARTARRSGGVVVLDLAGNLRQWAGRDPRTIAMILREVDIVHSTVMDLAIIGTDSSEVRRAMRAPSTIVLHDLVASTATGAFGEVRVQRSSSSSMQRSHGDCVAAICLDLARPPRNESLAARWNRVLRAA